MKSSPKELKTPLTDGVEAKPTDVTDERIEIERVDENERVVIKGNRKLFVRRVPENDSLWVIKTDKGPVPTQLRGAFTSPTIAYEAINNYWR